MNECINNLKTVYLRNNDIYIFKMRRLGRYNVPNVFHVLKTFSKKIKPNFNVYLAANFPCKFQIVTFSFLYRFSELFENCLCIYQINF